MQATPRQSKIHCTGLAKQSDKKRFTASVNLTLQLFGEENSRLADCLCHILHLFFFFCFLLWPEGNVHLMTRVTSCHPNCQHYSHFDNRQGGWGLCLQGLKQVHNEHVRLPDWGKTTQSQMLWIWQDSKGVLCFYFTLTDHRLKHPVFRCVCSPPCPLFFLLKEFSFQISLSCWAGKVPHPNLRMLGHGTHTTIETQEKKKMCVGYLQLFSKIRFKTPH